MRSALNQDLETISKVYAERGKRIVQQTETNRQLSLVLTSLGVLELVLVGIGVFIIFRSIARPLSVITSTIKQVAEGADRVEVPHVERSDEIGALARAIQIFQEAMERNRNLNSQVSSQSKAREERARHIETSVEEFRAAIGAVLRAVTDNASKMRNTAQSITRVTSDANGRAVTAAGATEQASRAPPKNCQPRCRRSAGRFASPPPPSNKPACGPKNRSTKSKALPPPPSGSMASSR